MSEKLPSPCIDVCKFRRAGHCIGCSMTKAQKKKFKKLDGKKGRVKFVQELRDQQEKMGKYAHWVVAYRKKCDKKNARWPFD
ncbi:MAG: DUF1289 domain-containing protein [Pseudomonadota bacterium]